MEKTVYDDAAFCSFQKKEKSANLLSPIDFRRSLPPGVAELDPLLSAAFEQLSARRHLGEMMHGSVSTGSEAERATGARFLFSRLGDVEELNRLTPTNGTQSALVILLGYLVPAGKKLAAEQLSYGALRSIARLAGVPLTGLLIDDEGVLPDAFEAACRTGDIGALYCNPTVHNPTTAIMNEDRRLQLAEIARRYGVAIIEDDALGRLHLDAPPPIARLAPDICWYIMTTSKAISHGLRLAYLVAPTAAARNQALAHVQQLSFWNATPVATDILQQWIASEGTDEISAAIRSENVIREAYAREQLGHLGLISKTGSMHVWLPLPPSIPAAEFARSSELEGVLIRPAALFTTDEQQPPNAIRLSLSTPSTRAAAFEGLELIRGQLEDAFARPA